MGRLVLPQGEQLTRDSKNFLLGTIKTPVKDLQTWKRDLSCRRRRPNDIVVMRSSQLDAAKLDVELTTLLREQFETVFSLFNQVNLLDARVCVGLGTRRYTRICVVE